MVNSDEPSEKPQKRSDTEIFEEYCPYYMSLGMTYDQYWDGDNLLPKYYYQAEELRKDRIDAEMWTQAMYIYEAICDATPLMRPFAKPGTKAVPFRSKPFREEMRERKKPENRAKQEMNKMLARMQVWVANTRRTFKSAKKGGNDNGTS